MIENKVIVGTRGWVTNNRNQENNEIIEKKGYKYRNIIFVLLTIILLTILSIAITPKELQNDTFYTIKCS